MMESRREYASRDKWGRGEWDREPDRLDFVHAGFACFILRNNTGNLCGYVGVPREHPLYGVMYEDLDVHGGITYHGLCSGDICHVPGLDADGNQMPDDVWWFGFDTGHYQDLSPYMMGQAPEMGIFHDERSFTYRNIAYVRSEVEGLAEQLREKEDK